MSIRPPVRVIDAASLEELVRKVLARVRARRQLTSQDIAGGITVLRKMSGSSDELAAAMAELYKRMVIGWNQTLYRTGSHRDLTRRVKLLNDRQWVLSLGAAAERTGGAPTPRALRAQLSESLIESHHLVREHWFDTFRNAFAQLSPPWRSPDDMIAIAVPQLRHNRDMRSYAKILGIPESLAEGIEQPGRVHDLLDKLIVDQQRFGRLTTAEKARVRLVVIPGQTKASELVDAYIDVYSVERYPDLSSAARSALIPIRDSLRASGQ